MPADTPQREDVASTAPPAGARSPVWLPWGLAALLVILVGLSGLPGLDSPWILGDEYIFIARNPEVNGAGLDPDGLLPRLALIFRFPPVEDLYQPLPILSYAADWRLSGGDVAAVRRTDVLVHVANALLLWWMLWLFLRRGPVYGAVALVLAWALALLWALHPALVTTFAADMGRTHLLSATFTLTALGLYVCSLERGRAYLFVVALVALVVAMLCKPVVGWVLLAAVVEAGLCGWRSVWRGPRVYAVGIVCVAFAIVTYWTSQRAGLVQDAAEGLFGDPIARSALAVWIYFRDIVCPWWVSWWQLPDPRTGWGFWQVWVGLALGLATVAHAWWSWQRTGLRIVTIGWAWWWALLLPLIGVVGAREAAATDRYLYQPLMGAALVAGVIVLRGLARLAPAAQALAVRPVLALAALVGAALMVANLSQVSLYRSTVQRGEQVARLNPGDPRALEAEAVSYSFAKDHRLPTDDVASIPAGGNQYNYFNERCLKSLRAAAGAKDLAHYFPGPADRAPFHRRLSFMFKNAHDFAASLEQAELARELQPDAFLTWVRLAHAYHGLQRWDGAVAAYTRCEELLPKDPLTQATHFCDFGYLYLFDMKRPDLAWPKFQAAVATGHAPPLAFIGLALCEIRVGEGGRGAAILSQILDDNPNDALAALALAEYHLRSEHWDDALVLYGALIQTFPAVYQRYDWYYEALRGFQTLCTQFGEWEAAARAWDNAVRLRPDSRELRSFRVWAITCAGEEDAPAWIDELLENDPDNAFGCLSQALRALRAGDVAGAVGWVRRARRGEPLRDARAFERAMVVLRKLGEQDKLPAESAIVQGTLCLVDGQGQLARTLLQGYVDAHPESEWAGLARELAAEISDEPSP
ncbi:MAG: tetratricopeptide repeat protein [Phycisphaerae bacterium]|jgi:tetratricopeptide (TPR) repeat protein